MTLIKNFYAFILYVSDSGLQCKNAQAISFPLVRTTTQRQSVYPDIALHISNYCVYCHEDQNLTHDIHYKCIEIFNQDH
jgi:hypothetical protein